MTLAGTSFGEGYQVLLEIKYKGEGLSDTFIVNLSPLEAKEMLEDAKSSRTISFQTTLGEEVLIYTSSLMFIKRRTVAGGKKNKKGEEDVLQEVSKPASAEELKKMEEERKRKIK